ncbi:unnamed protein product [Rotaria socialis]|uniref:B box-type domain-containing protein n=1 Tax=Rotaria socialis TaxID=392032 RepID=A0A817X2T6_9BILA|nr:unnamed protein product [Rotaria socialis]CAF3299451.1 unnamed protein product [Rotaria socialis]CAF3362585.1 unnamed protein product [Rotaria socialis]CAF3430958.1 unnamed protein product [Rotaria socialis]CAF3518998.1 unnamed protein product [Rotaria socialis]
MESSNEPFLIVNNTAEHYQNPCQVVPCNARQYLMCPHCSFYLCFKHAQQHQHQIQNETFVLHNRAKILEKTLKEYKPVEIIIGEVMISLNEWKQKMHNFIDQYSEQIKVHIEQAQNRLNDQWIITREEYLEMLHHFIVEPIDQLQTASKQIHPDEIRQIHARLVHAQDQITNLLAYRDLIRINFDSCSLDGNINISRGHFPSLAMPSMVPSLIESSNRSEDIPRLDRTNVLYRFNTLSTDTSALGVSSSRINDSTQIFVTWTKPNKLVIFDAKNGMTKYVDVEPSFITINDIIWCDYLNVFLISGAALHTFDVINNDVKKIFTSENPQIWSITTHKTSLFICYVMGESPLIEHRSLPSFRTIQTYTRSQLLPTDSSSTVEIARCIRTNDYHIAMTVRNLTTYEWRVDIFNRHMQRLFKGEILGNAVYSDYWCCLLTCYRSSCWLIMNNTSEPETLTLIDKQARIIQQIQCEGYNICVLHGQKRFVIKDQHGLAVFRF